MLVIALEAAQVLVDNDTTTLTVDSNSCDSDTDFPSHAKMR